MMTNALRTAALQAMDARFDPAEQMLWGKVSTAGYHTKLTAGSPTHLVLEAFQYALDSLATEEPQRCERGVSVLRRVLSLQVTDPTEPAYGVWPWSMEEPVPMMAPPDWNWADFCGFRLATIVRNSSHLLPADLAAHARAALHRAAWCVFRRNVQPSYTNIAIMGGGFTAAAGEILGQPALVEYGRRRLQNCVASAEYQGGFNEYNSPTYTTVVIAECDRTLNLVQDEQTRAAAERLRYLAWQTVAESFHPATQQWAGPHSRTYGDYISVAAAEFLSRQTGVAIKPHPRAAAGTVDTLDQRPCPEDLKPRFAALPSNPLSLRRRFQRREPDTASTYGTTWHGGNACLGTVNDDTFWIQRRPILGYWRSDADPANVLRVRMLHDGNDFASGVARTAQAGPDALSIFTLTTNKGDHHDHLDRPADGLFKISSLKIRVELSGNGAKLEPLNGSAFRLVAGPTCAVVVAGPSCFDGKPATVVSGAADGVAWVDIVFYGGPARAFRFTDLVEAWATMALSVQPIDRPTIPSIRNRDVDGNVLEVASGDLMVDAQKRPQPR